MLNILVSGTDMPEINQLLNLLITVFIIYIPIFGISIFILTKRSRKYSVLKNSISSLARLKHPYDTIFNILVGLYGILSISSIVRFLTEYNSIFPMLFSLFYFIVAIGTLFIGIFSTDENSKAHKITSILLFSSLLILGILASLLFLLNNIFIYVSITSFLIFLLTLKLIWEAKNMKYEKGYSRYEWSVFIATLIWNLLFSVTLLQA